MRFDNLLMMVLFLSVSLTGGLLGGVVYYQLNLLESTLKTVDFQLPLATNSTTGAPNITSFQDVMNLVIYPMLMFKDAMPYLVYFMMFAFIIGLALTAYMSSKNPIFFVLHILFTILTTYFAIILSQTYTTLLKQPFINQIMIPFTIFNTLMLYLPQVIFLTSIVFGAISFVNVMKPQTAESPYGLNYGGDY